MNADVLSLGMQAIALLLALAALVCAGGVMMARSFFAIAMYAGAAAAFAAGALLALGAPYAALAIAVVGAGLTPVLVLAVSALTARAARPRRRFAWLTAIGALAAAALAGAGAALGLATPAAPERLALAADASAWLAPLLLVLAFVGAGLLGFGERGVFERRLVPGGDE
ncbi:MAG: hypothetical protein AB7P07_09640 [Hyphomonadaceae bacterium]